MDIRNSDIRQRVSMREIYRYLGYGTSTPDETVRAMTEEVLDSLTGVVKPRNIYNIYHCSTSETEVMLKDSQNPERVLSFKSRNLSYNLKQCNEVILFAATLGLEADKLMQKYEILNMTKATITQACGAASIEAYCNILQERICDEASSDGEKRYLRPRFSPGYGDLPLQYQRTIFDELQCTKRIGLTLTDSLLMYPTKSVTAFIGLTSNPQSCHIDKCKNCNNIGCEFRNES
ncbi:MAG: Vitamin B12 dependent methionine synthase activation subunit [Lachnospiraceae bacterium]|nr:Vitamin B12 dependent methionine synthase activation subunit [Lachnospiraceae bacterium]